MERFLRSANEVPLAHARSFCGRARVPDPVVKLYRLRPAPGPLLADPAVQWWTILDHRLQLLARMGTYPDGLRNQSSRAATI